MVYNTGTIGIGLGSMSPKQRSVTIDGGATNNPVSLSFAWGDGTSSSGGLPASHTYTDAGP